MRPQSPAGATLLAVGLLLTVGTGVVAARPSDGYRDTQDFAYADLAQTLDACRRVDVRATLVAGDLLKGPLDEGAPTSWSDLTVFLFIRDDCAGTVTELTGSASAPPDITRLERAAATSIVVTVLDASGALEADVTATLAWTVAGPAESVATHDLANQYFRAERIAPAIAEGGLQIADVDGDLFPGGLNLPGDMITGGAIGFANEIALCCP